MRYEPLLINLNWMKRNRGKKINALTKMENNENRLSKSSETIDAINTALIRKARNLKVTISPKILIAGVL